METSNYYNPVRVHFGEGCLDALQNILGGRKALVLAYPEASYSDLLHRIEKITGDLLVGLIDDVPALPEAGDLHDLYNCAHHVFKSAEVIIALGGGSVMDTGKILATSSPNGTFAGIMEAIAAGDAASLSALPVIAIPTTAGTGSEVTPWATFWDRTAGIKYSLHHSGLFPEAALVDPSLTRTLPPDPTLASGLDALSHALEAIWNRNANPISDLMAVHAAIRVFLFLPELMKHPDQIRLRAGMAKAALFAGLAFSNTQTALAHSISYPMTLRHGLSHGVACSFCLPLVLRKAIGRDPGRDAVLKRIFGEDIGEAPNVLEKFLESLGVSTRFSDYGVGEEEAERIIDQAGSGARGRNFI